MMPEIELKPEFVEFIPAELEERTLYIAAKYRTVVHRCGCGCGRKIVTPLSPTAWKLTFDGLSVTLHPSVGNWNLPCKSHYWIDRNRVRWAPRWPPGQIEAGREAEARATAEYYGEEPVQVDPQSIPALAISSPVPIAIKPTEKPEGFLRRWKKRLFG